MLYELERRMLLLFLLRYFMPFVSIFSFFPETHLIASSWEDAETRKGSTTRDGVRGKENEAISLY